ncbi:MAG: hypothetical protein A2428_12075 [Bdellovibrionales bacterium RIFOXYC1_FULL_54_43]|nr:MAG: hypothetical protein A2428_12075 [Bdellovibrionales bacterium RIFOXYC1_FULL_54_43]OFZ80638.1 MAG: hypothetical protein A2603_10885 [Bdellovibrionales bacterium RIFOXYD1_FULL_55_31]
MSLRYPIQYTDQRSRGPRAARANFGWRITLLLIISVLLGILSGCSHWKPRASQCNPLGGGPEEDCFLPFPSSFYSRPDLTTATGIRVDLTDADLPRSLFGTALDPSPYNARDGFSTLGSLLAYFPARISGTNLPGPDNSEASLKPTSPVQLIEFKSGRRVPIFAEIDANARPGDRQALILQPVVRLKPKTRYIAVIQDLRKADGTPIAPLTGFRMIRDGSVPPGSRLEVEKERLDEIFSALARQGINRDRPQLTWDFITASDEDTIGRLLKMRDRSAGRLARNLNALQVLSIERDPKGMPDLAIRVRARFNAPSYLEGGNGRRLNLSAGTGEPEFHSMQWFPLTIHVPACARHTAKANLPIIIYGHGTFNSAEKEMTEEQNRQLINRLCAIQVGTDWLGRAKGDLPHFVLQILRNWNEFPAITDRLQQAHLNFINLARLLRSGALNELPGFVRNGQPLADSKRIHYFGISEGGCQGVTTLALSPEIDRGAMNVPCGFWSMFFFRSSDFYYPRKALSVFYPGTLQRQKLMTLSQLLWDYTDPGNFAAHILRNPLPSNQPKRILYQEGINDASVPNLTTRAMVRELGLKLLQPSVEPVPGIEFASGPLDSAYVQYDIGIRPRLGSDNIPPMINPVHEAIRRLPAAQDQLKRFFDGDPVFHTCGDRPCVFKKF